MLKYAMSKNQFFIFQWKVLISVFAIYWALNYSFYLKSEDIFAKIGVKLG